MLTLTRQSDGSKRLFYENDDVGDIISTYLQLTKVSPSPIIALYKIDGKLKRTTLSGTASIWQICEEIKHSRR